MNVTDLVNGYEVLNTEGGEVAVVAADDVVVVVVVVDVVDVVDVADVADDVVVDVVVDVADVDNNDSLERE